MNKLHLPYARSRFPMTFNRRKKGDWLTDLRTYSVDLRSDSIAYHHSTQGLLHLEPAVAIDRHVLWCTVITTGNQITKTKQCAGN
jgi:hypothetical protein